MTNPTQKDQSPHESDHDVTRHRPGEEKASTANSDETAARDMKETLLRARQTVKPIINQEEKNEIVSEDILNFKMG